MFKIDVEIAVTACTNSVNQSLVILERPELARNDVFLIEMLGAEFLPAVNARRHGTVSPFPKGLMLAQRREHTASPRTGGHRSGSSLGVQFYTAAQGRRHDGPRGRAQSQFSYLILGGPISRLSFSTPRSASSCEAALADIDSIRKK